MTHGCGGMGGGGGGFSGGCSAPSTVYVYSSGRRSSGGGGECCICAYPRTFFYLFFSLLLIIAPLVLIHGTYGPHRVTLSPRDTRMVEISPFFNWAVRLEEKSNSYSSMISAYLYIFRDRPPLQSKRDTINVDKSPYISQQSYEYWGFELIPPASAYVQITARDVFDFYLFKGYSDFKDWVNDASDNKSIAGYHLRSRPTQAKTITLYSREITHHGEYYFVVANPQRYGYISPRIQISLTRSLYNVTRGFASRCAVAPLYTPTCEGSLDDGNFAIMVAVNKSDVESNIDLSYSGLPRVSGYLAITLVPAVLISAIFGCIGLRYYRRRRRAAASRSVSTTTTVRRTPASRPGRTRPAVTVTRNISKHSAVPAVHHKKHSESAPLLGERSSLLANPVEGSGALPTAPPLEQNTYGISNPPTYEEATA